MERRIKTMKDEIIRKQGEFSKVHLITMLLSTLKGLKNIYAPDEPDTELVVKLEQQLAELKEQDSEPVSKSYKLNTENMDKISKMANQDGLLADMELEQSAEERPKIEDYFKKGVTMSEVHKEYTGSPVLFKYAQALDSYIDEWINKWKGE